MPDKLKFITSNLLKKAVFLKKMQNKAIYGIILSFLT